MDQMYDPDPIVSAAIMFAIITGVGALLAGGPGAKWLVDAGMAPESTFNWLVFAVVAGSGAVAASVVWVGLKIVVTQRRAARHLVEQLAIGDQSTSE